LALVYGFKKIETMREVVGRGLADLVSMSRPFIREADLVKRLKAGQREVSCIRCDACFDYFGRKMLQCWNK